jgi:glycosyltransferase involved in cell wall biosynthesis
MITYLLIHAFRNPDDGAFIRVKNLNSAIAELTSDDCWEIVLVSLRHFRQLFNNDKDSRIFQRRLILPILWTNRHLLARIWNLFSSWLVGMFLAVIYQPDIIVGETSSSWRLAWAVKSWCSRSRLIMDLHGAVPEEILFHYLPSQKFEIAVKQEKEFERDIVLNSDLVICQSENMIEHLKIKYPDAHAQFHPFQCSVRSEIFRFDSEIRSCYRHKLDVKEAEILFVYCGSIHKWQNVQYSVGIFAEYLKLGASSAVLLIMCPNPGDELLEYAYSLGLSDRNFKIIKVPHEEVSAYLSAADVGFLIRDNSVVNLVASPTKLGEYLACGLPVIVGDVAHSWPPARLDSSCFCFVDLDDANGAAKAISQFLDVRRGDLKFVKQNSISLAERSLANMAEAEQLKVFIKQVVLGKIH